MRPSVYLSAFFFSEHIEQAPLNRAFGSISRDWVYISPLIIAVDFRISFALTFTEPSTSPRISAFSDTILPVTLPLGPITILPLQLISPSTFHPSESLSL